MNQLKMSNRLTIRIHTTDAPPSRMISSRFTQSLPKPQLRKGAYHASTPGTLHCALMNPCAAHNNPRNAGRARPFSPCKGQVGERHGCFRKYARCRLSGRGRPVGPGRGGRAEIRRWRRPPYHCRPIPRLAGRSRLWAGMAGTARALRADARTPPRDPLSHAICSALGARSNGNPVP